MSSTPPLEGNGRPPLDAVLRESRTMSLGPTPPHEAARPLLEACTHQAVARAYPGLTSQQVDELRSALWLYHDFLDESHVLSQAISTANGSLLHGIMHRREGDYSNAKYWFRQAGHSPLYEQLSDPEILCPFGWDRFDPYRFVDMVAREYLCGSELERACVMVQQAEWWGIFRSLVERSP